MFLRRLMNKRTCDLRSLGVRHQPSWYAHVHAFDNERNAGKLFLVDNLGISCLRSDNRPATDRNPNLTT